MKDTASSCYRLLIRVASAFQSPFLLVVRLFWGWQFAQAGWGKLAHPAKVAEFFGGLGIPFPYQQAIFVGFVESAGGLCLILGLASRLVSIPLAITLVVAYLTTDLDVVRNVFSDPDKFLQATPFLFLFAVLVVLIFGPGKISLDYLLSRKFGATTSRSRFDS